jgi:hypothetical protein
MVYIAESEEFGCQCCGALVTREPKLGGGGTCIAACILITALIAAVLLAAWLF